MSEATILPIKLLWMATKISLAIQFFSVDLANGIWQTLRLK